MGSDYFESTTTAIVLSWIFAVPLFVVLIVNGITILFKKYDEVPRVFIIWLVICIIILSPFRYLLMQVITFSSYTVQSWSAFFSSFLLYIYLPILYYIQFTICVLLPPILPLWILGILKAKSYSRVKLLLAFLLVPLFCLLGSFIFLHVLPIAGKTTHWLQAENVVRSTNGPTWFIYKYTCTWLMPIDLPQYGREPNDKKALFRNHIASIYLSEEQNMRYLKYAYPEYYATLPNRKYSSMEHFRMSLNFAEEASKLNNQWNNNGQVLTDLEDEDVIKWIDFNRKALYEAKFVDIEKLNSYHPNYGNHFRDEYIKGLQLIIDGYDNDKYQQLFQGQFLVNSWVEWFNANIQNIKEGNKIEITVKQTEINI